MGISIVVGRARIAVGMGVVGWALACAGGDPVAEPVPEPAPEQAEPAPKPAPGDDPEAGDDEGATDPLRELTAVYLEAEGKGCRLQAVTLPGAAVRTLLSFDDPCPDDWAIALQTDGSGAVLYSDAVAWRLGRGERIEGPKDGIEALAFDGDAVVTCAEPKGAVQTVDTQTHAAWRVDGEIYEIELDGMISGAITRSWELGSSGWKARKTEAIQLHEGQNLPFCRGIDGWPWGGTEVAFDAPPLDGSWSEAPQGEVAALNAIDANTAWSVNGGGYAAASMWFEGLRLYYPVAWKPGKGAEWTVVPGLKDGQKGVSYAAQGRWLLVDGPDGAVIRNARTGKVAWRSDSLAALWPGGVALPGGAPAKPGKAGKGKGKRPD